MSPRVRVIALASMLVVFFGLGAGWLFARAASNGSSNQEFSTTSATGTPSSDPSLGTTQPGTSEPQVSGGGSSGSSSGGASGGGENPGGVSPGGGNSGGGNPPRPTRSVRIAGADLAGAPQGEQCALLFIDDLEVTVQVEGVSVSVNSDSGTVVQDDRGGCAGQSEPPFCAGGSLTGESSSCLVGVNLDGSPAGTYEVGISLDLRVRCTSPEPVPCNQIESPLPTPAEPVDATWSDSGPSLTVDVEGATPSASENTDPDTGDTDGEDGSSESTTTSPPADSGDDGPADSADELPENPADESPQ